MTEDRWLAGALGCVAPPAMAVFREPEGVRQGVITPVTGADTRFRVRALRMNSRVKPEVDVMTSHVVKPLTPETFSA